MSTGALLPPNEWITVVAAGDHAVPQGSRGFTAPAAAGSGPLTDTQPIEIRSVARVGVRATTFFEDYYNRIHVSPKVLDFGAISGTASLSASVWNAYVSTSTLDAVTEVNPAGTTLFGPTLPKTLKPLETLTLRVDASADGPPTIDATYLLDFGGHGVHALSAVGTAAKLWSFVPNWRQPVQVNYEFKTQILNSRSAREQRSALRTTARRTFEFTSTVSAAEMRRLQRLLITWQNRTMVLPDPVRKVTATIGMPGGTDSLKVADVPDWLFVGASVVLTAGAQSDTRFIESIVDDVVTFTKVSGLTWPNGTIIRPALTGFLDVEMRGSTPTNNVMEIGVSFSVDPASEPAPAFEWPTDLFNDREVFIHKPNWAETPQNTFIYPREQIEFGRGRVRSYFPVDFATRLRQSTFVGRGYDEIEAIARFFARQKGQRGEFYMPTGENDLPLRSDLVAGTNFLRVIDGDTFDAFADDTVYRAVSLLLRDGRRLFRTVTDMYVVDDVTGRDTIIETGDETWLSGIAIDDILMVSWMPVWRCASDVLTLEYLTDTVAQTQLTMRSLEDLPPETDAPAYDGAAQWVSEVWGSTDALDAFDRLTNTTYPAIFWWPVPWVTQHEDVVDSFDALVNVLYPEAVTP